MEFPLISIALNIILIILIGAVIFYARRLSESIAVFRSSRDDMKKMIRDLSIHIDKADAAIKSMRRETDTSADDLHFMITKAKALSEELQFIQESGDRLANRLEGALSDARYASPKDAPKDTVASAPRAQHKDKRSKSPPRPLFNIIDRDGEDDEFNDFLGEETEIPDNLKSQAERDLAKALQRQQKTRKG